MSLPNVALLKPEDVNVIERSQFWHTQRLDVIQTSIGPVLVKAQRQQRHPIRYALLSALAFVLKLPMIKAAPAPGGVHAQHIEVLRLSALRQAGVQVPAVLHSAPDWFAMEYVDAPNLLESLQRDMPMSERLAIWLQGAKAMGHVHARGQALSQAFARNCLWYRGQTWFIDFEDDPVSVMPLEQAQARDWFAYLHSTVWALRECGANWADLLPKYEQMTSIFKQAVAEIVQKDSARMTWLRHLPQSRKPWGRDVVMLQALGEFFYLAEKLRRDKH
jgi:tRNA A-37 threonylcarbamoyl transferase component Bud32